MDSGKIIGRAGKLPDKRSCVDGQYRSTFFLSLSSIHVKRTIFLNTVFHHSDAQDNI